MGKIYLIKKRAIISAIAVALTFCISSIAVPLTDGVHTKEILNNAENKTANVVKYNTIIKNPVFIENSPYDDSFIEYWEEYEETVEFWHKPSQDPNIKNFQEWYENIIPRVNDVKDYLLFNIGVSFILCLLGAFEVKLVSLVGWAVLGYNFLKLYNINNDLVEGYLHYVVLKNKQVDILVHVKGNTTGPEKNGIDNLWTDQRVVAKNTDAINECDGSNGKTDNLFTYYLGPADDIDQPGWYSIKKRYIPEYPDDLDEKAPRPPGNWTLEIKPTPDWNGNSAGSFIKANGTMIYEITLEPR